MVLPIVIRAASIVCHGLKKGSVVKENAVVVALPKYAIKIVSFGINQC